MGVGIEMVVLHSNVWDSELAYDMVLGNGSCFWTYELYELGASYCCYAGSCPEWLVIWEPYVRLLVDDDVLEDVGYGLFSGCMDWFLDFCDQLGSIYLRVDGSDDVALFPSWTDLYGVTVLLMESLYSVYFSELDGGYRLVLDDTFERIMFRLARFSVGLVILHGGLV